MQFKSIGQIAEKQGKRVIDASSISLSREKLRNPLPAGREQRR